MLRSPQSSPSMDTWESKGSARLDNSNPHPHPHFLCSPRLCSKVIIRHHDIAKPDSRHTLARSLISPRACFALLVASMLLTLILTLFFGLRYSQAAPVSHSSSSSKTVISLSYGQYQGIALANGITQWLGMRYAAPPIGDLRFAAPQNPPKFNGVLLADKVCHLFELITARMKKALSCV